MRRSWMLRALLALMAWARLGYAVAGELTPEARALMDKGQLAMEQREWRVAIRHLLQAQEKAPDSPDLLYSLGVAESNVPGRELRAMAWLHAYLLAAPSAPDADAVRKEIEKLDIRVEGLMDKLARQVLSVAAKMDVMQSTALRSEFAQARAMVGDLAGSRETMGGFSDEYLRSLAADDRPPVAPKDRLPELLRLIREEMGGDWSTDPDMALKGAANGPANGHDAWAQAAAVEKGYKAIGSRRKDLRRLVR